MWDWLTINPAFTMEFCMPKGMKSQEKIKAQWHRTGWRHCFFYSVLNSGGSDVTILDFYCTTITNYKNIYDNRIVMFTRNLKKPSKIITISQNHPFTLTSLIQYMQSLPAYNAIQWNWNSKQPKIITLPPPCFTVAMMFLLWNALLLSQQT